MREPPFPSTHNGPPTIDSAADLPPGLPKMHYFKCDIEALWNVLVELPFDVGGFYMRALLAMYKHMEGLPADDNVARMRMGGIDIRTYRRMKAALLAQPKCLYEKPSGRVSNPRFEEEISAYVVEFRNRQNAAKDREAKKRDRAEIPETFAELPAEVQPKSDGSRTEVGRKSGKLPANLSADLSEKRNRNNDPTTTILPERPPQADHEADLRARVTTVRVRDREKKREESKPPPPEQVAAPASGGGDQFSGLNGTGDDMARFIARHAFVTEPEARRMLTTNCQVFGANVMMEAYATVLAKMSAEAVGKPYLLMIAIARKLKESAPAKQTPAAKASNLLRRY